MVDSDAFERHEHSASFAVHIIARSKKFFDAVKHPGWCYITCEPVFGKIVFKT